MKQYGGIFEAVVQAGDLQSKQGKMTFELRGEGTLPSLQILKPTEVIPDGTAVLNFGKTRIGKDSILSIVLTNEGQVPATVKFDAITNDCFSFEGQSMSHTIMSKSHHHFDIRFAPKVVQAQKFILTFQTQNNMYECHKVALIGEGYAEPLTFEDLPLGKEDELRIGDCVVDKPKAVSFKMVN